MNIYFACSITGGRASESAYQEFTRILLEDGHDVPTAHLAGSDVMALEKVIDPREVYERDVAWIRASDALIAEVSVPSHGVGYEIGYALEQGKSVLCLAQEGLSVSKMITGNPHPVLQVKFYRDVNGGIALIREFLANIICE
ncbi:MAG: nucleoside 2-deoxyribosyltransferase [Anaerolineales bacterium]|nr:nucleoside 2-deoxyribosyltransferase [Anaerolineales bacterium]